MSPDPHFSQTIFTKFVHVEVTFLDALQIILKGGTFNVKPTARHKAADKREKEIWITLKRLVARKIEANCTANNFQSTVEIGLGTEGD